MVLTVQVGSPGDWAELLFEKSEDQLFVLFMERHENENLSMDLETPELDEYEISRYDEQRQIGNLLSIT